MAQNPGLRVQGADRFAALARSLNEAGRGDLTKELQKALQVAVKPLTPASRAEALRRLPSRGGFAARVAATPQRVTARGGGSSASVRVSVGRKGSGARGAEDGQIRHPVFGHRPFVSQRVRPGWFSDTADAHSGQIKTDIVKVLDDFTERIVRGV